MNDVLVRLKYLLNSYSDTELKDMELWIDNNVTIDIIAVDENAVSLITNKEKIEVDGRKW